MTPTVVSFNSTPPNDLSNKAVKNNGKTEQCGEIDDLGGELLQRESEQQQYMSIQGGLTYCSDRTGE